jgi:hypothetical protein
MLIAQWASGVFLFGANRLRDPAILFEQERDVAEESRSVVRPTKEAIFRCELQMVSGPSIA